LESDIKHEKAYSRQNGCLELVITVMRKIGLPLIRRACSFPRSPRNWELWYNQAPFLQVPTSTSVNEEIRN